MCKKYIMNTWVSGINHVHEWGNSVSHRCKFTSNLSKFITDLSKFIPIRLAVTESQAKLKVLGGFFFFEKLENLIIKLIRKSNQK